MISALALPFVHACLDSYFASTTCLVPCFLSIGSAKYVFDVCSTLKKISENLTLLAVHVECCVILVANNVESAVSL